jgi:2-phosphosulfolactate phosphatase
VTHSGLTTADADQQGFAFRFGWGADGLAALAPVCDVIVVVDVLRFTTAVSVAVAGGSTVFPFHRHGNDAVSFAAERGAVLAGRREDGPVSLSPTDLLSLPRGSRIVMPSPDGAALSVRARELGAPFVLAGSLRNAAATAHRARSLADDRAIAVIASGDRWPGSTAQLRPSVEDLLGAGAVLAVLDPAASVSQPGCSPEAAAARSAFVAARPRLADALHSCVSGRELTRIGFADDVECAAQLDAGNVAAQLVEDAYIAV